MAQSQVAIVLGAGPNVGTKVAQRFTSEGYKVAVVSRSGKEVPSSTAALSISADLTRPESVHGIFEQVRSKLGEPSVVVYNAAAAIFPSPADPFSIPLETFSSHLAINTTSAFAAAKEALASFSAIKDEEVPKVFIYTGNILNTQVMPPAVTLGVGKSATAHWIEMGSASYGPKGYGFYYADERTPEGKAVASKIDGDAHAEHYFDLVKQQQKKNATSEQVAPLYWQQTFVKGKGYVKFPLEAAAPTAA